MSMYTRGVFIPPLTEWFNWDRGDISGAYSLSMIMAGFLALVSGRLTDRFGPRLVISFLGLLTGGGLILMSVVTSLWQVYLIWGLLIGVGGSCSFTPITSTLPKWITKQRGLAIGICFAGFSLGGIIWPPVVERLITILGWQTTYIIIGLVTLIFITILAQLMKHSPQRIGLNPYGDEVDLGTTRTTDQLVRGVSFAQAIKTAPYWLIGFIRFGSMFTFQLISVHIYPHIIDVGISEIVAATVISITAASGTVSRLLAGFIADRIGNRLTMVLSAVVLIMSLIGLFFAREVWHFYGFALFFGIAWGGIGVAQVTLIAELFGPRSLGAIIGSLELFLTLGGALGVWLAGIIFDTTGSYTAPFVICLIQAVLVTIFGVFLILRKRKGEVY